ncbi:DUF1648 domain-containing protein [Caproiciproducens sp. MSJ-32]|uniref:DUF1648 domain-containing protein n=1 Tax=Caproiciproducens sp. MSJ-32 TaxID=2841527 RepID=UPI001C0F63CA|nr:DUF5808 domain-containing protein [Caproiciproducens sp. MSJ-32]MBU5455301.1 DUF1648 domain-containing protein [Caproiciproducens sp. MSJ-32]
MDMIIIYIVMVFLSIISFFQGLFVNKFSNNGIIFGVRVPEEFKNDEDIKKLEKEYKKIYILSILPTIFIINFLLYLYFKVYIFISLILFLIVLTNLPLLIFWKRMLDLKKEKKWDKLGKNIVVVDTSIRKPKNKKELRGIKNRDFLFLIILPIITLVITFLSYDIIPEVFPTHYNGEGIPDSFVVKSSFSGFIYLILLPIIQVLMILLFMVINKFAINGKTDINSGSISEIREQRKIFKKYNSIFLFIIALKIIVLFSFIQLCTIYAWNINIISGVLLSIIFVTLIIFSIVSYKIGQGGKNIKVSNNEKEIYRDDDKYWILGNFYYNKNDPSIFIEKRIGIGWDVNLGNPIGMAIMVAPLLIIFILIIVMAILGI